MLLPALPVLFIVDPLAALFFGLLVILCAP
jgi:hypothetical protein